MNLGNLCVMRSMRCPSCRYMRGWADGEQVILCACTPKEVKRWDWEREKRPELKRQREKLMRAEALVKEIMQRDPTTVWKHGMPLGQGVFMTIEERHSLALYLRHLLRWKEELTDIAVVDWSLSRENQDNPSQMVADLIENAVRQALDPAISKDAEALIERGRAMALGLPQETTS